jgi:hypothetical protein
VYFENFECLGCGTELGLCPERRTFVAVTPPIGRCANHQTAGCNWLMPAAGAGGLCLSCGLTRTRPHDADLAGDPQVAAAYVAAEAAKRRLVFQLLELGLPFVAHHDRPDGGLAFDLLLSKIEPVTIGHSNGLVTIDLAEVDDAHRERLRQELAEPYRTMLGHLRHEVGHYYWQTVVASDESTRALHRALFGDERVDYATAIPRHYDEGPPPGWEQTHVSAYATAHPWEDWAETFAHYLHIRDTLQTAAAFGVIVTGPRLEPSLMAAPSPYADERFDDMLANWIPLSGALNAINRSMGHGDLYPFVLSPRVIEKLRFVHEHLLRSSDEHDRSAPAAGAGTGPVTDP